MTAYATEAEAQTYLDTYKIFYRAWTDSSSTDHVKALNQATYIIDRLNFVGEKADEDQALQFPRGTDTEIPDDIKNACTEIALALLDGINPELEFENLRMIAQGYGNVRSTHDPTLLPEHQVAGVPSLVAWQLLKPYLHDNRRIDLKRIS